MSRSVECQLPYSAIVIDGKNLLFRSHSSHRDLSVTLAGEIVKTGGPYGFLTALSRLHLKRRPAKLIVAWESRDGRNFRRRLYPDYKRRDPKAFTEEIGADVNAQIPRLSRLLRALGVEQYHAIDSEADDVIGRLSAELSGKTGIYSGDSDMLQLVGPWTTVIAPRGGTEISYTATGVKERYGIGPRRVAALKALSGDSSDNIPGAQHVGPVSAAKLLNAYGTFRGVLQAASEGRDDWPCQAKTQTSVANSLQDLEVYYSLTRIRRKRRMEYQEPKKDRERAIKLLKRYKMRSLLVAPQLGALLRMGGE